MEVGDKLKKMNRLIAFILFMIPSATVFPCISNVSLTQTTYTRVRLQWDNNCPAETRLWYFITYVPLDYLNYFDFTQIPASNGLAEFNYFYLNSENRLDIRIAGFPLSNIIFSSTFTSLAAPPDLPETGSPFVRVEANAITLQWKSKGSLGPWVYNPAWTQYEIYVSTSPSFFSPLITSLVPVDPPYSTTIWFLSSYTTYYAQVRAINKSGIPTAFVSLGSTTTLSTTESPASYSWAGGQWRLSVLPEDLTLGESMLFNGTPAETPLLSSDLSTKIDAANNKLGRNGEVHRRPLCNGLGEIRISRSCLPEVA